MRVEKSAGAIIFRRESGGVRYLLLHRVADPKTGFKEFWGFRGLLVEEGEDEIETVRRELKEETGLEEIAFIPGFRESIQFFFRSQSELVKKIAHFYLAETKEKKIKLSEEHDDYAWLPLAEALNRLTPENSEDLLENTRVSNKKAACTLGRW